MVYIFICEDIIFPHQRQPSFFIDIYIINTKYETKSRYFDVHEATHNARGFQD